MKRILIVDDSRAMQTIVRRGIEQLGYDDIEIKQASSAVAGLDIIRNWEPNLVLCDWHMPEMTGLELLYSLNRQMLETQIGFVTTESAEERKKEAFAAGAKFFVQKPFDTATLHNAVLPLIQGSTEGEAGLTESEERESEENHIMLPDARSLHNIIQHFCQVDIKVSETSKLCLSNDSFPYLLGLLECSEDNKIRAVSIMDLDAVCILGGAITAIPIDKVLSAIGDKAIPKPFMHNCNKLLEGISVSIFEQSRFIPLKLRSTNAIRKRVSNLEKLLEKPADERIDVIVSSETYGEGRLTILAS